MSAPKSINTNVLHCVRRVLSAAPSKFETECWWPKWALLGPSWAPFVAVLDSCLPAMIPQSRPASPNRSDPCKVSVCYIC